MRKVDLRAKEPKGGGHWEDIYKTGRGARRKQTKMCGAENTWGVIGWGQEGGEGQKEEGSAEVNRMVKGTSAYLPT